MKASVIREMTTDEIRDRLADEKQNLLKLKMQHAVSPLENPIVLRDRKKDVARLLTELTKRAHA